MDFDISWNSDFIKRDTPVGRGMAETHQADFGAGVRISCVYKQRRIGHAVFTDENEGKPLRFCSQN